MPDRTCIGCGKVRGQAEMVRLRLRDGKLSVGKGPGRGAYLCGPGCAALAVKKKAFGRAFRGGAAAPTLGEIEKLLAVDSADARD